MLYDASFRQHCNVGQDEALGRWGSSKLCAALWIYRHSGNRLESTSMQLCALCNVLLCGLEEEPCWQLGWGGKSAS